ncbi:MAG: FeoA family protein [Lawsonella sp.]|nr:ferrous iron transport protein A [Mycobacteriales bacterium]
MQNAPRRLSELTPGSVAVISGLDTAAPEPVKRRLSDLGFTPGTVVTMLRRAPLRDPAVFQLRNYEMCLRKHESCLIYVDASTDDPSAAATTEDDE